MAPIYESKIYNSKHGFSTIILPEIIVSVEKESDLGEILKLFDGILYLTKEKKNRYVLGCKCNFSEDVLRIVKKLENINGIKWCKPGMLSEIRFDSNNNTYFYNQYNLQNSPIYGGNENAGINAVRAWTIISGNPNIKVAVIDQGVERNHEDLQGAVIDGYTCHMPTEKGDPIHENEYDSKGHGMACAGIIAAIDNSKGTKGVASGVKILPINISPDYVQRIYNGGTYNYIHLMADPEEIADAIDWSVDHGADILSCSWGHEEDVSIINSLNDAMTNGREGKGCIIVASSGNFYHKGIYSAGFPANLQGVICVGAINREGNIWNYSQRGYAMDLVAPSGNGDSSSDIVTTDRMGNLGYNPNAQSNATELPNRNYTQRFGGTSAACPQVAGVAALMLSANPNLTTSQVREILRSTAKDLGAPGFDTTYGYGLVDAYAAVYAVAAHDISGPQFVYTAGSYSVSNLQDGATVEWILSDNFYNQHCLQQNYPAPNQCTITYSSGHYMINATLTATIKYNGNTIQTLTKTVSAYDDFHGQYTSDNLSGEIDGTHQFYVKPNVVSTITSPMLQGASVGYDYSGTIPTTFNFSVGQRKLYFTMPANNNGKPVIINVEDLCGNYFKLYAMPYNSYYMNITYGDGSIDIEMKETVADGSKSDALKMMNTADDQTWQYEIWSSAMGTLKTAQTVSSRSTTISTAGWPKGVYIIKAKIGKEEVTEKIVVK